MAFGIKIVIHAEELAAIAKQAPGLDTVICELASQEIKDEAYLRAAVDTGEMRDSITRYVYGKIFRVIAEAPHSAFVEWGTRRMAAQPFMTPAAEAPDYDGICQEALRQIGF